MINQALRLYIDSDYEKFPWASEEEMMAKINAGVQLETREEMTSEYYDELVWLLVAQMDSEYVGAYGYMPLTYIAPQFAASELKDVPGIVHDEFTHGNRIRDILNSLGFDADRWVEDHQHEYSFRLAASERMPNMRPTQDFRVNIFYYDLVEPYDSLDVVFLQSSSSTVTYSELVTWINFALFQFLQDRGAGEQIRDTLTSSFAPWARENTKTMREENKHIRHGDTWMAELFSEYPDLVQQQFGLWLPRSLATFGRKESKRNDLWRKFGLKRRANKEIVVEFLERTEDPVGLQIANKEVGLKISSTEEILATWQEGKYLKSI